MSSKNFKFLMLNYELLKKVDFNYESDEKELKKLDEFMNAKVGDD